MLCTTLYRIDCTCNFPDRTTVGIVAKPSQAGKAATTPSSQPTVGGRDSMDVLPDSHTTPAAEKEVGQTDKSKLTKKKFALVISYCGTDFRGFVYICALQKSDYAFNLPRPVFET